MQRFEVLAMTRQYGMFQDLQAMIIWSLVFLGICIAPVTLFAADRATEQAVEQAVQKAAEKVAEKAAEQATEKAELTAKRPDAWRGPTKVHFLVFVIDIDDIDDANQSFATNVYLRLRWKDSRLANPGGATRQVRLEEIWNPRVLIANQQGRASKALPDVAQVEPDGTVPIISGRSSCRSRWWS
jgi:hypothetical protein